MDRTMEELTPPRLISNSLWNLDGVSGDMTIKQIFSAPH
jgi:hypothetical protein